MRINNVGQCDDVIERGDVRKRARLRRKASEGGKRLYSQDVELRARRVAVLNQLPATDLARDFEAVGGDCLLDCFLPLGKTEADRSKVLVGAVVRGGRLGSGTQSFAHGAQPSRRMHRGENCGVAVASQSTVRTE